MTFRYQGLRSPMLARVDVPYASSDGSLVLLTPTRRTSKWLPATSGPPNLRRPMARQRGDREGPTSGRPLAGRGPSAIRAEEGPLPPPRGPGRVGVR